MLQGRLNKRFLKVVLVAFLFSILYGLVSFRFFPNVQVEHFGYTPKYINIANSSIQNKYYSTELNIVDTDSNEQRQLVVSEVQREPLYPVTLIMAKITGLDYSDAIYLQFFVLCVTLTAWLTFIYHLYGKKIVSIFCILLFFSSSIPFYSSILYPYIYQFSALSFGFISLYFAIRKDSGLFYVMSGLFIGISIYERAAYLLLPLFITASLFILNKRQSLSVSTKGLAILLCLSYIIVAPWIVRNIRYGVIGMSAMTGYTLGYTFGDLKTSNPSSSELEYDKSVQTYGTDKGTLDFIEGNVSESNTYAQSDKEVTGIVVKKILSNIPEVVRRIILSIGNYADGLFVLPLGSTNNIVDAYINRINIPQTIFDVSIFLSSLIALIVLFYRKNILGILAAIFIVYNALFSTTIVTFDARYRGMVDILVYLGAALFISKVWLRFKKKGFANLI